MSWTDERTKLLKKLWAEGLSASQIAGRLGGITRNGVVGKIHRLGLSGRTTTTRISPARVGRPPRTESAKPKAKRRTSNSALRTLLERRDKPFVDIVNDADIPVEDLVSVQELGRNSCRWPIGDPKSDDFGFCGREKVSGLPYCEAHCRRAFEAPKPRGSGEPMNLSIKATRRRQAAASRKERADA